MKKSITKSGLLLSTLICAMTACGNSKQTGSYVPGKEPVAPQTASEESRVPADINWLMMKDYWQISESLANNITNVASSIKDLKQPEVQQALQSEIAKLATPTKQIYVSSLTSEKQSTEKSILLTLQGIDDSNALITYEGALRVLPKAVPTEARIERIPSDMDISQPDYWFSQRGVEASSLPEYFDVLSGRAGVAQSSSIFKEAIGKVIEQKNAGRSENLYFSELTALVPVDGCNIPDTACVDTYVKIVTLETPTSVDAKSFVTMKIRTFNGPDDTRNTTEVLN